MYLCLCYNTKKCSRFSATRRKGRGRSQSTPQPVLRPRRTLRRSQPTRERSPDSAESSDESPVRQRTPAPVTPRKSPSRTPAKQDSFAVKGEFAKVSS